MKAVSKILAGGVAIAALASAAPAAAQYYPGYGYGGGGNAIGQVLQQVFGGYGANGYNSNTRTAAQQCAAAVEQRINGGYGNSGYGNSGYGGYNSGYGGYGGGYNSGYGGYGSNRSGARVLAITHADRHSGGRIKVKGVATSGMTAGYGGGYNSGYGGYGGYGGYNGGYGGGGYNSGYGAPQTADLKFNCTVDYRGYISRLDIDRNTAAYGYRGH